MQSSVTNASCSLGGNGSPPSCPSAWKKRSRKVCASLFSSPLSPCANDTKSVRFDFNSSGIGKINQKHASRTNMLQRNCLPQLIPKYSFGSIGQRTESTLGNRDPDRFAAREYAGAHSPPTPLTTISATPARRKTARRVQLRAFTNRCRPFAGRTCSVQGGRSLSGSATPALSQLR